MAPSYNKAAYMQVLKHGRFPALFMGLILLFSLGGPRVTAQGEPMLTLSVVVPEGPFAVGESITIGLNLTNPYETPLASVQLDLPYVGEVSYTAVPGLSEAIPGGTVTLGDISTTLSLTLTIQITSYPERGEIPIPFQVRTAATDPIHTTVTLPVTPPAGGETSPLSEAVADPTYWQFTYNPPGVSAFTGSATYSYPIAVPPGMGGLTPSLSLNYSSRGVDGLKGPVMSRSFGAGWSMPQAEIVNGSTWDMYEDNPNCCGGFDNSFFTLVLNGVSYQLTPGSTVNIPNNTGRYRRFYALGEPGLYIAYLAGDTVPNTTGEYWLVRTADGTAYQFGYYPDAEQLIAPVSYLQNISQWRNQTSAAASWKLDTVTDVYGRQIRYTYYTQCGLNGGDCRVPYTEVDVAVQQIQYNFSSGTPQTTISFEYGNFNQEAARREAYMTVGSFRAARLIIRQAGQIVSGYELAYEMFDHDLLVLGDAYSVWFWWPTQITPYGTDYTVPPNPNNALPAQVFTYEQDANRSCYGGVCAKLLTRVANGYGAVTRFIYQSYNDSGMPGGHWNVVSEVYTWDGVRAVFNPGNNNTAASRLVYNRTGYAACFERVSTGCDAPSLDNSNALVGFSGVKIDTQTYNGSSWVTLSRREEQFDTNSYWLNGKTLFTRQLDPANGDAEKVKEEFSWTTTPLHQAHLAWKKLFLEGSTSYHTYETYSYYDDASYGALHETRQYKQDGTVYRCTQQAYAHQTAELGGIMTTWLINRPIRQTTYAGNCGSPKIAETLYRYDGSTAPTVTTLNGKAALERTLTWVGETPSDTRYVTSRVVYDSSGLPQYTYSYHDYSSSSSNTYAGSIRNTQYISAYNNLGLPTTIQTLATGVVPQSQTIGYESLRPWLVTSLQDANTDTTSFEYDKFGRLRKVIRPGDSSGNPTLEYRYSDDAAMMGVNFTVPLFMETRTANNLQQPARAFYNGLGQLLQSQQAHAEVGNPAADRDVIVTYAYEARGLAICQTQPYDVAAYAGSGNPYRADNCTSYNHTTTDYDALGRVYKVTAADNTRTVYHYGTLTLNNQVHTWQDVIDPNRHRTAQFTDAFGRLAQVAEFSGNCGNWTNEGFTCSGGYTIPWAYDAVTSYAYNQRDQLTSVTDAASNVTTMSYDALGRKLAMSDPDMGNWSYSYDASSNLLTQLDAKGQLIDFGYDNLNRLTGKVYGSSVLATYTYDQTGGGNNGIGRLTRVDDQAGYHTFFYDHRGRLTSEGRTITGSSTVYTMQYGYDALDRLMTTTYPNGEVVTTGYNNQGLPENLSGTNNYVMAATYNAAGQRLSVGLGNNRTTTYTYYSTSQRLWNVKTTGDLQDLNYIYDYVGNIWGIVDHENDEQIQGFTYDHRDRLIGADTSMSGDGQYDHQDATGYSYNEIGNITGFVGAAYNYTSNWSGNCTNPPSQAMPHAVRYIGSQYFCYDQNGNMNKRYDGVNTYTQNWDVENRLTSVNKSGVGTATFDYDANGQRMKQVELDGITTYSPFPGYEVESRTGKDGSSLTIAAFRYGINCQDNATGSGYILYSLENVHTRFAASPPQVNNAEHFLCVKYSGGQWQYDNSTVYVPFTPRASDVLVASVNFNSDTVTHLNGQNSLVNGMASGYVTSGSNLVITPDQWNGGFNDGEFGLSGSSLIPNVTRRVSYSFGGQAVAIRVTGDPTSSNNGVFYLHTDHLGSTSLMSNSSGNLVTGSISRYYPFGDYRGTLPTQTITDRGYTGHVSNNRAPNDLGLIYMNARYYLPGIARFASADTLIPNPTNPQSFNRYSYVLNSPLNFTDPTGHRDSECDDGGCSSGGGSSEGSSSSGSSPSLPGVSLSQAEVSECFNLARCGLITQPEGVSNGTWHTYKLLWHQLMLQNSPYLLSNGRISDQYLVAILIRIELNGASGDAYLAALEALSSQYDSHCNGGCASLGDQLEWLDSMQGWWDRGSRPISIDDCPWCMSDAAKAIAGYQDGYEAKSWWWGNPLRGFSLARYIASTFPNAAQGDLLVDGNKFIVGQRGGDRALDFVVITYEQGQECYSTAPNCMGFSLP